MTEPTAGADTRTMRTRQLLVAASVAGLLLAACGGDDGDRASDPTSTTADDEGGKAFEKVGEAIGDPEVDAEAPEGCQVGSGDADALEALMPEGPAGFEQQTDDVGDTGPSDLEKAVDDDGEDDARASLTESGFLAGYQRYWISEAEEADLILFVYEFCDGDGAQAYLDRSLALDVAAGDVDEFEPAGLSGARGESGTFDGYTAAQVVLVHDQYLVMTQSGTSGSAGVAAFEGYATDLAKAAIARIDAA